MARTDNTLLLGDLETCKLSEVEWRSDGDEKFIFDNESVCIVYYNGELTIVMYGKIAVRMCVVWGCVCKDVWIRSCVVVVVSVERTCREYSLIIV